MPRRLTATEQADAQLRALDEFQARPCVWCEAEPKQRGDHLGAKCRAMLDAKRKKIQEGGGC